MNASPQQAKEIFVDLINNDLPENWEVRLAQICAGDDELRRRVQALLRAHREPDSFLEQPAIAREVDATTDRPPERPGTQIGPYKVLQQIGEGGFGIVFMAEQIEPVRRRVALKVIKPGMDTRQVIARFEAERQALAVMDHPNIAKVLDAGATESGRPYFVMELVRGTPITQYCDENNLPVRERLELFATVCQAIQHAHTKGIIHRDIKPTNVLVTRQDDGPVVKVIDFGIAKAMGQQLTDKTLFTDFAQMIGTPLYMSPEQAELSGTDIDTRSDIYSLGVLLYELLTGTTPVSKEQLKQAAFDEIRRIIREEEPQRPSTRISTTEAAPSIAAQRHTEPAKLTRLVRGELDWIVMKALEKDRRRRYETASALAADLQRYLADEPVQACPPSAGYRLRKFARRNMGTLATIAVVAATLFIGTFVSAWQAIRATHWANAEELARRRADEARIAEVKQRKAAEENLYRSLIREVQALRASRATGYRERAWKLLNQARLLDTPVKSELHLRQEAVLCMGDFVGLNPKVLDYSKVGVSTVALNHNATLAAVGVRGGDLVLHRLGNGAETVRLRVHKSDICFAEFGKGDNVLVTGDRQGVVCVWKPGGFNQWNCENTFTVEHGADWKRQDHAPLSGGLTPDGSRLAACYIGNPSVQLIDLATGTVETQFTVDPNSVQQHIIGYGKRLREASLSSDGKFLAATAGGQVFVWDVESGEIKRTVDFGLGVAHCVAFSRDGRYLACGCEDGVKVLRTDDFLPHISLTGEVVRNVAFSPDNKFFAYTTLHTRAVSMWDLVTGREVATLVPRDAGLRRELGFSSQASAVAVATPQAVTIWSLQRTPEKLTLAGHAGAAVGLAYSRDGRWLASGSKGGNLRIWDARTGDLLQDLTDFEGSTHGIAFSPSGRTMAVGDWGDTRGGQISFWDTNSWKKRFALKVDDFKLAAIWHLAFGADGQRFAACGMGIAVWDVSQLEKSAPDSGSQTLKLVHQIDRRDSEGVVSIALSPDCRLLAAIAGYPQAPRVRIWNVETWKEMTSPPRLPAAVYWNLAFLPDSRSLVYGAIGDAGATSCHLEVWDTRDDKSELRLDIKSLAAVGVSLSADGRLAASCNRMSEATSLWDIERKELLATLPLHISSVRRFEFSPDGQQLAVARADGGVSIWSIQAIREQLAEIGLDWSSSPHASHN